jgi:type IV pilus assembly protein PilB
MADENENTSGLPEWSKFVVIQSVSLQNVTIPPAIIEMVPESVARENVVVPLSQENGVLRIVVHDPSDIDTIQKLVFVLNKTIQPVLAPKEQIVEAINRHYGQL